LSAVSLSYADIASLQPCELGHVHGFAQRSWAVVHVYMWKADIVASSVWTVSGEQVSYHFGAGKGVYTKFPQLYLVALVVSKKRAKGYVYAKRVQCGLV
jgi:hypothetical protein